MPCVTVLFFHVNYQHTQYHKLLHTSVDTLINLTSSNTSKFTLAGSNELLNLLTMINQYKKNLIVKFF